MSDATVIKPAAPAKPKRKRRGGLGLMLCVMLVAMVFLLKGAFIFFLLAMLPSIVAYVVDIHPRKYRFQVIAACNLAGAMPYLSTIVAQASATQAVRAVLADPNVWLVVYAAASLGWALNWLAPYVAQLLLEGLHASEANACRATQKKLVEEWGDEVHRIE